VIVSELADNPLATWSQFLHEMDSGHANAGRIAVKRNLTTLCGGFALFHGDDAQRRAAARFRSLYEQAQIGGAKAVNPAIEHVDGGGINPEATFERGADARRAAGLDRPAAARAWRWLLRWAIPLLVGVVLVRGVASL
jgi:hypothetical protein